MEQINTQWGYYINIVSNDYGYKIKQLFINPNKQLSLESHNKRSEHWLVIKGNPKIVIEDKSLELKPDDHFYIPVNKKHRIENETNEIIEVIEVQFGNYLREDDIITYEDDLN